MADVAGWPVNEFMSRTHEGGRARPSVTNVTRSQVVRLATEHYRLTRTHNLKEPNMKHLALLIAILSAILVGCSDTPTPTLVERRVEPYNTYWDLAAGCEGMDRREAVALLREANGNVTLVAGRTVLACGTSTSTSTSTTTTTSTPVQLGEASVCELRSASYEAGTWTAVDGHIVGYSEYEDSEVRDSVGRLVCPPLD